jgi:uncharacterized protein
MLLIDQIPALLRVGAVFVVILFLIRKRVSLENAFFLGALVLSLLFELSPVETAKSMATSMIYPKTLSLAAIVSLILILSRLMELSGQLQRMLKNFEGLISSPRLNLIVFPALIGLLPMPGGAVFSAPMVKELAGTRKLSADRLSFINYWFRHIWEYWWPLYPGVLLATLMSNIDLPVFILFMCPLTISAIGFGYFQLKTAGICSAGAHPGKKPAWGPFIKDLTPILVVILPGLGMGAGFSWLLPGLAIGKELGLIIALILAIGWVWTANAMTAEQVCREVFNRRLFQMVLLIFAILVFKGVLEDSDAVNVISDELFVLKIPLVLISILLPFLIGMITGITIAFVGATFPILIPLIHAIQHGHLMLPYVMLALTCGFIGVLLSPLHLCFILSNQYFATEMRKVYRHLWLPCGGMALISVLYYMILVYAIG